MTLKQIDARPQIQAWLFLICAVIFAMILVGGATRLTDSGLSITEWKPLLGAIPPLSDLDWQQLFEKYKKIPEYQQVNKGMSLNEFKFIYWWEWGHRLLGRLIGILFLVPFLWFAFTGRITRNLYPKLIFMFVLGGLQGFLGWYMVKSGLVDRVDVSQYRLAAHMGFAVLILGYIFWVALGLSDQPVEDVRQYSEPASSGLICFATILILLIFIQIILGAFVAGIDAGKTYNTWPLMDGDFIPDGLWKLSPWWLNLFENITTVQFDHRMMAYLVVAAGLIYLVYYLSQNVGRGGLTLACLVISIIAQTGLGIWTLLEVAPLDLSLYHQGGAIIVFALAVWHLHSLLEPVKEQL